MIENTFPKDRTLSEPERLRLFAEDKPLVKACASKLGVNEDEAKRRGLHVGLRELAGMFGVSTKSKKAA